MTLLIMVLAAAAATIVWYAKAPDDKMKLGTLCLMYWGASLMWLVDAFTEYFSEGAAFFRPSAPDMLNDAFLGLSAVALGLVIWLIVVLVSDPEGKIKAALRRK